MIGAASDSVVRQIELLFQSGSALGLSDRQLLEWFNAQRDRTGEAAFSALVMRHGPMVLTVCRQLLGDRHLAEDAFQAVFLVLARKAHSIRDPDLLGNWLYGVALRTAHKARGRLVRQRKHEEGGSMRGAGAGCDSSVASPPIDQAAVVDEQAEVLHNEVARLPKRFRLPVVLCYFEGLSLDEAARRLRCPAGTVHSRLARARDKLRRGLTRRGVVLPAVAITSASSPRSTSASISSALCEITTQAAMNFSAGHAAVGGAFSAPVTALAQEVLRTTLLHKLALTAMSVLLLATVAAGAASLTRSLAMKKELTGHPVTPIARVARRDAGRPRPETKPEPAAPGRMIVAGRVLDSQGHPVAGAPVDIVGRPRKPMLDSDEFIDKLAVLGKGTTDSDGRFRLDAPRTSSIGYFDVYALTAAPGFGHGWVALNADAEQPSSEIRLRTEQVINGRLVDIKGQPVAGVEIRVIIFSEPRIDGALPDSISMWDGPPEGCRPWPRPVKSDDQGRFMFSGIGRGLQVYLMVHDARFASQVLDVQTDDRHGPKETTLALEPARVVEGRVLDADTGQAIPGALISVGANRMAKYRADAQGRFRAYPPPGDRFNPGDRFGINVFAPEGSPYLVPRIQVVWNKGTIEQQLDIKLKRGVLIRGKVTEQGTGRALSGSTIEYEFINGPADVQSCREASVASRDDGSFQMVVPPGKGASTRLRPDARLPSRSDRPVDAPPGSARRRTLLCAQDHPLRRQGG